MVVHKDVSLLNMMLGGMVLVTIFTTLTMVVQRLLLAHTTARIDVRLMSEFYRHVLSLPMAFFLTRNKGEIMARFGENAKIRAILTGSTITVVLNTLMLVIYFLMMFTYSLPLTFIVLAFIPGYVALILYFTPRIKALAQKIFQTNAQSQAYLIEALTGIETIKATANEYMARAAGRIRSSRTSTIPSSRPIWFLLPPVCILSCVWLPASAFSGTAPIRSSQANSPSVS